MNKQYKVCSICGINKDIEDFHKRKENGPNGRKSACKHCRNKNIRAYSDANREKENKRVQKWRKDNPDKKLIADRKWRDQNIYKVRLADRIWKAKNTDKTSAYAAKRRALKHNVEENFDELERKAVFARFEHRCFICKVDCDLTVDHHMPLSKGYALTINNATILCRPCNSKKGTKLPKEFYTKDQLCKLDKILKG